jgi:hypothetical protein
VIRGTFDGEHVGLDVAGAGDQNGDHRRRRRSPGLSRRGVRLLHPADGDARPGRRRRRATDVTGHTVGWAVAGGGDLDGDGWGDFAAGAPRQWHDPSTEASRSADVVLGPVGGSGTLAAAVELGTGPSDPDSDDDRIVDGRDVE